MVRKRSRAATFKRFAPIYLFALPGLIYLLINNILPLFGMLLAFKEIDFSKGLFGGEWVGLQNFKYLFATNTAFEMIRNTVLYNLLFIVLNTVCGVAVAIFLNEIRSKMAKKLFQSLILLPYLMSWVIVSYLSYAFLSSDTGFLNSILSTLGLQTVSWYSEAKYWPVILTIVNLWKGIGFNSIIYYSSVVGIGQDYYEAAIIDGATAWQRVKSITIPLLKPTIITMTILNVGHIFASDFGLFYQVTRNSGELYSVTRTIDVYVYNALMNTGDISMSLAASVFQSVVGFVLVIVTNAIVRKMDRDNALF